MTRGIPLSSTGGIFPAFVASAVDWRQYPGSLYLRWFIFHSVKGLGSGVWFRKRVINVLLNC
jgi:hypothetical protein